MDWPKRPLGCSPCGEKFRKGHLFLPGGASHQITKDHGLKGNPFPQGLETAKWSVHLPMVQERGTEQGLSGKPPANEPLPPGPHLQLMPRVLHNQH